MKNYYLIIFITLPSLIFAQKEYSIELGQASLDEINMLYYEKDSTAKAVVLYEYANRYIDKDNNFLYRTDYYYRVKIFNKQAFEKAKIEILDFNREHVKYIEAKTYNLTRNGKIIETKLLDEKISETRINVNYTKTTFILPNVKEGSVIEYKYSIISNYFEIDDWVFQSDIPKVKSEIRLAIIGNHKYNIRIKGSQKLDKEEIGIKKRCIDYPHARNYAGCELLYYGMNNIPAFVEENYMTSKKNFMSRLIFDIKSSRSSRGVERNYTQTWTDAEKFFKNIILSKQISDEKFFRKKLSQDIISEPNQLEKAKQVFQFIRNHYTWDYYNWNRGKVNLENSFKEKHVSVANINLSLFNTLKAAGIKSNVVLLSTRANGLPTKLYPVIKDFNYIIVKVEIDDKEYFLDATNKFLSFGDIPFRCLNGEARILDYKKGGYWQKVTTFKSSNITFRIDLKVNDDYGFDGEMNINKTGYLAIDTRDKIDSTNEEEYIESIKNQNNYLLIDKYKNTNLKELDKPFIEYFKIRLENETLGTSANVLRINPFILGKYKSNPFKLKERNYPVDFGYTRKSTFLINITIPDNYKVTKLAEDFAIKLPNNGGLYIFKAKQQDNKINIYSRFSINKSVFSSNEYLYLKEFHDEIIAITNSFIEITRKD